MTPSASKVAARYNKRGSTLSGFRAVPISMFHSEWVGESPSTTPWYTNPVSLSTWFALMKRALWEDSGAELRYNGFELRSVAKIMRLLLKEFPGLKFSAGRVGSPILILTGPPGTIEVLASRRMNLKSLMSADEVRLVSGVKTTRDETLSAEGLYFWWD